MRHVAMTGANGFLGWHTRCAFIATGRDTSPIAVGESFSDCAAATALEGSDRLVHIAGVNRGSDTEVLQGNVRFAQQIADALEHVANPPQTVVYASSSQVGNGSVYGYAKQQASGILGRAAERAGADFVDVQLPNLFGEHGRPFYNSVVSTFCHLLATGGEPQVENDKELELLHVQDAAEILMGSVPIADAKKTVVSVSEVLRQLQGMRELYATGDIPDIHSPFARDLFNTYRSFSFAGSSTIQLQRRSDRRGSFFEIVRAHGGQGQTSFSTTAKGISRGDHFHRRKVERFAVLSGDAVISLRRLFTKDIVEFAVSGATPSAIDMPTMWAHKISNTGSGELSTAFWSNEIFDPKSPDTFAEAV